MDSRKFIEKQISGFEQHQREGFEDILKYYGFEEGESGKERKPHNVLRRRAETLLMKSEIEAGSNMSGLEADVDGILRSISVELLLKAYVLKEKPDEAIYDSSDEDEVPEYEFQSFDNCVDKIDFSSELDSKQSEQMKKTLELIRKRRNNTVHSNYHRDSYYAYAYPIYQVIVFLLSRFPDADDRILNPLKTSRDKAKDDFKARDNLDFNFLDY